ncbi:MAG: methyltransferase domain-containing protein [Candidatus Aenigmatarchaeota archaeon]
MAEWVEYGQENRHRIVKEVARNLKGDVLEIGSGHSNYILKDSIKIDVKKADFVWNLNDGLPFPSKSIDNIIACEIIEHMNSPHDFVKEISRVLKKEGNLILTTPNIACLKNRLKLLFGKFPINVAMADFYRFWYPGDPSIAQSAHYSDYSIPIVVEALRREGFIITEKKSNGIYLKGKLALPLSITPATLGENMIIKARLGE